MKKFTKITLYIYLLLFSLNVKAENIQSIIVKGNERISKETILMFSDINDKKKIDSQKINQITKNLYESNFFENVSVILDKKKLIINVKELPLIESISLNGLKAEKIKLVSISKLLVMNSAG